MSSFPHLASVRALAGLGTTAYVRRRNAIGQYYDHVTPGWVTSEGVPGNTRWTLTEYPDPAPAPDSFDWFTDEWPPPLGNSTYKAAITLDVLSVESFLEYCTPDPAGVLPNVVVGTEPLPSVDRLLAQLTDLKRYLPNPPSTQDALLSDLLERASAEFLGETGAAFDDGAIPSDVRGCVVEMAALYFFGRDHVGVMSRSSSTTGDTTSFQVMSWPVTIQRVIDRYRVAGVA